MIIIRGIFILAGLLILGSMAHTNIIAAGGYDQPTVLLMLVMPVGVAASSLALGYAAGEGQWLLALFCFFFLCTGEVSNFQTTAERLTNSRETRAAPVHEAAAKRKAAEDRIARLEGDDRVERAERALRDARSDANARSTARDCNKGCIATLAKTVDDASAAVNAARESLQLEQRQARAALDGAPLPGSANALADRLGLPTWLYDLTAVGLSSLTLSGMAVVLLTAGAHSRRRHVPSPPAPVLEAIAHPIEITGNVVAITEKRKAVALQMKIGDVDAFLLERVKREAGTRVSWADAFVSYRGWCEQRAEKAVDARVFGARLDALRDELGHKVRSKGQDVWFVDLKLAS